MAPPKPPSKAERVVRGLQKLNLEYATVVRWTALGAFIYGTVRGRVDVMVASAGLGVFPNVVGKPS